MKSYFFVEFFFRKMKERKKNVGAINKNYFHYFPQIVNINSKFFHSDIKNIFRILMETREMFEEQLNSSRKRADKVLELEAEIIKCKQLINDMALVNKEFILIL